MSAGRVKFVVVIFSWLFFCAFFFWGGDINVVDQTLTCVTQFACMQNYKVLCLDASSTSTLLHYVILVINALCVVLDCIDS